MFSRVGYGLLGVAAAALVLGGGTVHGPDEPLPDPANLRFEGMEIPQLLE